MQVNLRTYSFSNDRPLFVFVNSTAFASSASSIDAEAWERFFRHASASFRLPEIYFGIFHGKIGRRPPNFCSCLIFKTFGFSHRKRFRFIESLLHRKKRTWVLDGDTENEKQLSDNDPIRFDDGHTANHNMCLEVQEFYSSFGDSSGAILRTMLYPGLLWSRCALRQGRFSNFV